MIVKCQICKKEKYISSFTFHNSKTKKFFCNHKCYGKFKSLGENKITKTKFKTGDFLGCYKLISFSYRIKRDYFWNVECLNCKTQQIKKLNKFGMLRTNYCKHCRKEKYINFDSPENYIKSKTTINENGCWIWNGHISKRTGYALSKYRGIQKKAHAFSYETFKGKIPKGLCVCHACDIRSCLNPDHLWLGTQKDNVKDCIEKGRSNPPIGESCGTSIFKDKDIKEIRILYKSGMMQKDIAEKYNCSKSAIWNICHNKTWKHLGE